MNPLHRLGVIALMLLSHCLLLSAQSLDFSGLKRLEDPLASDPLRWEDQVGHAESVFQICFTPDGELLVSHDFARRLVIWQTRSGKVVGSFAAEASALALSASGRSLVLENGKAVELRDLSGKILKSLDKEAGTIKSVVLAPGGSRVLVEKTDGSAQLLDAETLAPAAVLIPPAAKGQWVAVDPEGKLAVFRVSTDEVRIVDAGSGVEKTSFSKKRAFESVRLGRGGRVAASDGKRTITVFRAAGKAGLLLQALREGISDFCFSPDGTRIAVLAADTAAVFDADTGKSIARIEGATYNVSAASFFPNNLYLAAGIGFLIDLVDLKTSKTVSTFRNRSYYPVAASFMTDGRGLLAAHTKSFMGFEAGCEVGIWDMETGELRRFQQGDSPRNLLAAATGRGVIFGAGLWGKDPFITGELQLWGLDGTFRGFKVPFTYSLKRVVVSADGTKVLTGERSKSRKSVGFMLWTGDGELVRIFRQDGLLDTFEPDMSSDGLFIAGTSETGIVIWESGGPELMRIAGGYRPKFRPDGRGIVYQSGPDRIVLAGLDGRMTREIVLRPEDGKVSSYSFSPDGSLLAAVIGADMWGLGADRIRIYRVDSGEVVYEVSMKTTSGIFSANLSKDNEILAVALWNRIALYRLRTGSAILLTQFDSGDWVVRDETLRYDSSPGGEQYVGLCRGLSPAPEKEASSLRQPGLLASFLRGKK
ncbi:MAG: WD40 repeat domain-containing protein [Spirochaetia bacterium]